MRRSSILTALTLLALLPACANKFYTAKLDPNLGIERDADKNRPKQVDGVIVYQPRLMRLTSEYTVLTDDDGNVVATIDGKGDQHCIGQEKVEFKTLPDYSHPYALRHVPSQFASGSLQVQLSDGMITSVNTTSDPQLDETITALAGLVEKAAGAAAAFAAPAEAKAGVKLCNARPVLRSTEVAQ